MHPPTDIPASNPPDWLASEENAIRQAHAEGADGLHSARALAALRDRLIRSWAGNLPGEVSVVAVGAYGRGTLDPQVPVRFLVVSEDPDHPAVLDFLANLATVGMAPVMPPLDSESLADAARHEFGLALALLDARVIAGRDGSVPAASVLGETLMPRLLRDLRARHQRSSNTVYLQEPNVKECCGGLDDYHAMRWLCLLQQGTPDLDGPFGREILDDTARAEIEAAVSFLHRVRHELHFQTQSPTDRLTLMLQGGVSKSLHYPQRNVLRRTEALMRDFYRHAFTLHEHTTELATRLSRPPASAWTAGEAIRPSAEPFDGFLIDGEHLEPMAAEPFAGDANRLMRLFLHCQVRRLTPGPRLRQCIAEGLPDIDRAFRQSRANRDTFQAILEHKGEVAPVLRLMHRCGVLGRYLPEFGALDSLVQHEFFHRFTADEHTLRCIEELDRLVAEDRQDRAGFRRIFHELADPFAFYLALLLHDTGRAEKVENHTEGSAMLAAKLCDRLQISGQRRALIAFLVDHHLTLWRTATTRNLEDSEVIAEFAAAVKNQSNLDALLLFTFCDSNGTSPDAWNGWKESLMLQLHAATSRFLGGGDREAYERQLEADRAALRDEVLKRTRPELRPDVERHFELMPAAAFHYRQAEHIVTQIRTVAQFFSKEASASSGAFSIRWLDHLGMGYTELILVTRDRPMLLERLCCALAACEINILSADFFTRADHLVVDVFRVHTTELEPVADPALRERFLDCFEVILNSAKHDPALFLHHLDAVANADPGVPVRVKVGNDPRSACTTVEIQAPDRIGILHDLFYTVNSLGLSTAHARISTEKGVAMDTLFITTQEGGQVTDPEVLQALSARLATVVERPQSPP